ncbi:hypothetical protein [Dyella sp. 20L07]|uniref:hypothetical protein n=1 Tax=Dyella sp. 20L07 TaxID=3384240 RepID=UPI003D2A6F97
MSSAASHLYSDQPLEGGDQQAATSRTLISPVWDFLLLGGGSLIVLGVIACLLPPTSDMAPVAASTLFIANFVNHPHFAHSYQLFYRNFGARAFGDAFAPVMRVRYLFAAIAAPLALITFLGYCIDQGNARLLGFAANGMFLLVGWHYVKQGYGILMTDAALKRSFFSRPQKNILLANAYLCWSCSWLLANHTFKQKDYWGISYYALGIPDWLLSAALLATLISTISALTVFSAMFRRRPLRDLPITGGAAYFTSLYVWLLIRHPALLLVIPAFHSLQYLVVVWRYRINFEHARENDPKLPFAKNHHRSKLRFALFLLTGFILGYTGFWLIPEWLDGNIPYDKALLGTTPFFLATWVFINVHHYFIDNVIWRKDNPDTRQFLFGAK